MTSRIIDRINELDMSSAAKRAAIEDVLRAERVADVLEDAGILVRRVAGVVATPIVKMVAAAARRVRGVAAGQSRPAKHSGRPATSQ